MKELYQAITNRLTSDEAKASYQNAGLTPCNFVDLYRGQYINWEGYEAFPMPAVLFEWQANYDYKKGNANVTLHLCYEQMRDSSSISRHQDKALNFFDFIQHTHSLLEGLATECTGRLKIISEENVKQGTVVDVHILNYECSFFRYADDVMEHEQEVDIEGLEVAGGLKYNFG